MVDTISYENFAKLDLRIAKIIEAEEIEGADKLLKLKIEMGEEEPRTLVAGIKQHYNKEDLIGKNIVVIANLEPRKMKGVESQGMLLAASSDDHAKVILLQPEKDIEPGSKVS